MQSVQLYIWDPVPLVGRHSCKCPAQHVPGSQTSTCSGTLQSNSCASTLKLMKGVGADDRDVCVCTRCWECHSKAYGAVPVDEGLMLVVPAVL